MQVTKGERRIDFEPAFDHAGTCAGSRVGVFHVFQNLLAALHIVGPRVGEGDTAGGAVEQPGGERLFQLQHQAGDYCLGGVQPLGRLHKAAGLHHGHKGLHLA